MSEKGLIAPHGGKLVNLVVSGGRKAELEKAAPKMKRIRLPERGSATLSCWPAAR